MDDTLSRVGSVSGYWDWLFLLPLLPGQPRNRHQCKRKALASCMVVISPPPPCFPGSWVSTRVLPAAGRPCFQPRLRASPSGMASLL